MQVISLLYHQHKRNDAGKTVLRRAYYVPLMYEHLYFMYAIEQNWGLYYNRMIDQHATMQSVLYCLFDSYADSKDFYGFQKEWFPFSHSRFKQTTADMHKLDLDCSNFSILLNPRNPTIPHHKALMRFCGQIRKIIGFIS